MGKVRNEIVAIVAADSELFSSLQLTKALWDKLEPTKRNHPLDDMLVREKLKEVIQGFFNEAPARKVLVDDSGLHVQNSGASDSASTSGSPLQEFLEKVKNLYKAPEETGLLEALKNLKRLGPSESSNQ
jgi:CRISPR-associated protein Csc2